MTRFFCLFALNIEIRWEMAVDMSKYNISWTLYTLSSGINSQNICNIDFQGLKTFETGCPTHNCFIYNVLSCVITEVCLDHNGHFYNSLSTFYK